ncbi:TonB-dependent receptor domain-containing protein [Flavivirga spongiicola]|uniref:TonB-dependent receptor n=1 Tax=Flavivirga spongiicola TaxID=421621 RepID=A0ABU7XX86_9FLAO|nr:TonB-dependent receptor [Flavivirga sp. MEBiC05379]MDO5980411.1 TonB-dependent receptor [Flavivirga sp. MEBiC05379]
MNKFISTSLMFLLSILATYAQPKNNTESIIQKDVIITGKVLDKETKDPLEYATISFFNKRKNRIVAGGITDINGAFSIPVPKGTYDISIEYISFITQTILNKKITSNINLGVFSLEIDLESLDEVEIIAERTTVEIKLDKKIYNVGKDLTVSGGSVSDVLDNVPSVSVDGEGNVALRGNDNVRILINGKPSGLVGLSSTDALRQLPAESIQKVEVITSPSARYEAEGTAGILNIILRRSKLQGLNGSVTANVGHPDAAGLSGNINYRTGDINFFSTTTYRYNERIGHWYNNVKYNDINTPDLDEKRNWTDIQKGINTNTGLEWYINDSASLTTSVVYSNNNNDDRSVNNLIQLDKNTGTTTRSLRLNPEIGDNETIQYAANFMKNFKDSDHKLTFDFQYENTNNDKNSIINLNGIETEMVANFEDQTQILLQSDYVLPIGEKSQFEIGYRGDFSNNSTDFRVDTLNVNTNEFEANKNLTNIFNFKQYLTAAYVQFGSKIDKFSYLLGLRLENTKTTIDQPTSGDFKRKNLTGLFPTVNLNYEISDDESVTIGYNRRLRRPRGFMLNPFPSRSSITNVFQGNPDLDPTYTDRFELGYLNKFNKFTLSSALYYAYSTNVMTFVSRRTGETVIIEGEEFPVIERGPVNLATDNRYGFEFNLNYSPSRKWRINTDFNIFKFERDGSFNGVNLEANNLTWSARLTNKLTLPYKVDWQTNINYRGPSEDAQNNRKGRLTTNLAFSKDLFKEKASVAFNIRDLFNSNIFKNHITAETFTADQEIQFRGGRTYNLSFTYRFNQQKKQERNGGFDGNGGVEM